MLKLEVPMTEVYNEETNEFEVGEVHTLRLEHSLVSLSKWEQKYKKPFLSKEEKTPEEAYWYIRMMCLDEVPEEVFANLSEENVQKVNEYINDTMTATWFKENPNQRPSNEIVTSEVFYYWIFTLNIDPGCDKWHLNRLLTLIRVVNEKNAPSKKMGRSEMMRQRSELNAARRRQYNTRG